MINQLKARARQEISTVRLLWCGLLSLAVMLVGLHADVLPNQSRKLESNAPETHRNLDQALRHYLTSVLQYLHNICQWPPWSLFVKYLKASLVVILYLGP